MLIRTAATVLVTISLFACGAVDPVIVLKELYTDTTKDLKAAALQLKEAGNVDEAAKANESVTKALKKLRDRSADIRDQYPAAKSPDIPRKMREEQAALDEAMKQVISALSENTKRFVDDEKHSNSLKPLREVLRESGADLTQ